ncbi:hypothetical protein [Vitiosangium sp. GDMCC 1.1324]|uniref:hypothetical protein n=1 Tax=Vitiosangium sp. (strain GDMCC 1.1324) TaxID=2138576 RepID=UPI000D36ABC0|nr:hypothetical protein [Vitiosangium sp. GDMCC 1.1324]PTL79646.1 hypothetical protein DAT35_33090 [Vitiosangium sp. GDMCC 1.1324]
MRNTMKTTLAALASLALIPAGATASYRVGSPFPGDVTATTYYSSGSFHGAVDISSRNACGYWGVETGVVGSLAWNVTIRTTAVVCYGNGSGNQNEVKHTFANGYTFRQWHFLKETTSVDKTCDRCQIGDEGGTGNVTGPHSHLQYDKNGTNNTSWYSGYTTKGEFLDRGETVGYVG